VHRKTESSQSNQVGRGRLVKASQALTAQRALNIPKPIVTRFFVSNITGELIEVWLMSLCCVLTVAKDIRIFQDHMIQMIHESIPCRCWMTRGNPRFEATPFGLGGSDVAEANPRIVEQGLTQRVVSVANDHNSQTFPHLPMWLPILLPSIL